MGWSIVEVEWADPRAESLRSAQRVELDERYGSDDHEPGTPPSADDVPVFLVAVDEGGAAVACGGLRPLPDSVLGPDVVEVKRMFVDRSARGSGVAAAVLAALEDRARERGAVRLVLETGTLQPDAIRFYTRQGYAPIPLFGSYLGSEHSVCFGRSLRPARVEASADVDPRAEVGDGTLVWHLAQVRERARVGRDCVIGRGAYLGPGVVVGDRCKIQNHALVYEPAVLGDGVFVGPAVVFTNDLRPRAVTPDGALKSADDWHAVGVVVEEGAAIGARAVCVAPVRIGAWAMVAAGAVVAADVPPFALVVGVPARRVGWVGRAGARLEAAGDGADGALWRCPETGEEYVERDGVLSRV